MDFVTYTIRDFKPKERRISTLLRVLGTPDTDLVKAIRRSGIRFRVESDAILLSDMQVLNYILAERGEQQ